MAGKKSDGVDELELRRILSLTPQMLATMEPDGRISWVNQVALDYFGVTRASPGDDELRAHVIHPDDLAALDAERSRALASGSAFEFEQRMRRKDGRYRWFLVRYRALKENGRVVRWYGAATDIEGRRRIEAYLSESQRLTHTGSWAYGPDREPLYWSAEMFRIAGLDPGEAPPPWSDQLALVHPEDRQIVERSRDENFVARIDSEAEFRLLFPSGAIRHIHAVAHPVLDTDGELVAVIGTVVDVTERKRAEEMVRRSATHLAEAQQLAHTGSWVWDPKSDRMTFWSDELYRIYGFDPRDGIPGVAEALQRVHPEDRERVRKATTTGATDFEYRLIMPDGSVKHVRSLRRVGRDAGGHVVEVIGTVIDVTERKRAEAERERLQQLQAELARISRVTTVGQLTASLSHEIRQPIAAAGAAAGACLRYLSRGEPSLPHALAAAQATVEEIERAGEIIERVRSLFRKGQSHRDPVDVNEVARESLALLVSEAQRRSVSMRAELAARVPVVVGDRIQLQQVFVNLMLNAIESMEETGGELIVKSEAAERELIVSVSDTGAGLPKETGRAIFDPFFTTKPHGTGLGLSISRSIIESHGGRIWAESAAARGATFRFSLPVQGA